jgi:hypothetical protein
MPIMAPSLDHLVLFAASEFLVLLFLILVYAERRSRKRVWQLEQAAELLRQHGDNLEQFLCSEDAPPDLKAVLIGFSDALADERVANELAEILCAGQRSGQSITPDVEALMLAVEDLRARHPNLARAFFRAVGSGVAAALFRWPHAARTMEMLTSRMVADPGNELAAAAVGARLRSGIRYGMRPAATAA